MESVLRCTRCNKPFDKESTLKRHGYYCRSRATGNISRLRSCGSCAKCKARCDRKRPRCSRCMTKGIECHYPPRKSGGNENQLDIETSAPISSNVAKSDSTGTFVQEDVDEDSLESDQTLDVVRTTTRGTGQEPLEWEISDVDITEFLNSSPFDNPNQSPVLEFSSMLDYHMGNTAYPIGTINQAYIDPTHIFLSRLPADASRLLIKRPKMDPGTQRVPNLIIHTLKSYPRMMLHHNTLPPFIHPYLATADMGNNDMEPLHNCISLVHMISSGVRGSRKLFWKNVRLECEQLYAEYTALPRWSILAAMQALSIYILIRLDEGETEYNNLDLLLLATFAAMASRITCSHEACNSDSPVCHYGYEISWEDWIFEESRRRLGVIFRVINMLVYCDPGESCGLSPSLLLAPLPAPKHLWSAPNETSWKLETLRDPVGGDRTTFGLTAKGDLVRLGGGHRFCSEAVLHSNYFEGEDYGSDNLVGGGANWEEWCAGMDGFGGLVMLAASLVAA